MPEPTGGYRIELGLDLSARAELTEGEAIQQMAPRHVELLEPVGASPSRRMGGLVPSRYLAGRDVRVVALYGVSASKITMSSTEFS